MEKQHTIFVCDVCGDCTEDERRFVVYVQGKNDLEYHVCRDCISSFQKRLRREVTNAG